MSRRRFTYVNFAEELSVPQVFAAATTTTAQLDEGTAATGDPTFKIGREHFEFHRVGNATNIRFVPVANVGWTIPVDGTDAEGLELGQGCVAGLSQNAFVSQTDPAFFIQVILKLTTLANIDALWVGFRKQGAYGAASAEAADITVYDDYCAVGIGDSLGAFARAADAANAGMANVLATHAAHTTGEFMCLRVQVSAAGVTECKIGTGTTAALAEAALAVDTLLVATAFTMGAVTVVPCIIVGATAAGAPNVQLCKYTCGLV